jgi:photosystem II stability/assembly factor-like uncharacterized protein
MKKNIFVLALFFSFLIFSTISGNPHSKKQKVQDEHQQNDKNIVASTNHTSGGPGHAKYFRSCFHNGNLVTGHFTNSGITARHYVSGNLGLAWPNGAQSANYIHSGLFYIAAEVVDTRGDTIHIVSDNYRRSGAENSPDYSHLYGFTPMPDYYNMDGLNNNETPEIFGISEDVGVDMIPNTHDFGEGDGILQPEEDFNNNGILDLSMKNEQDWFAMNDRRDTWPEYWPINSYPGDTRLPDAIEPGNRASRWNGAYGAFARADQESYYVMDDRENDEFDYFPFENTQPWPNSRRGLGITVDVRHYQWKALEAEDVLFSVYNIKNNGKDLHKCIIGNMIDPDVGGSISNNDAAFDRDEPIIYAWAKSGISVDGLPVGYVGVAVLESPGNPFDGVDNDFDGMIDESQDNGVDEDNDWIIWTDQNDNDVWDNEDTNFNGILDSGEDANNNGLLDIEALNNDVGSDGIGPDGPGIYTGPDADGSEANGIMDAGEPNFDRTDSDESDQIGISSFFIKDNDNLMADDEQYWQTAILPGTFMTRPGYDRDPTFNFGCGYVPIPSGGHTRLVTALIFGSDLEHMLNNKKTVANIYDNDFRFSEQKALLLKRPNGGEDLQSTTNINISWGFNSVDLITIEFSLDDGSSWSNIASAIPADSLYFAWTVPDTASNECRIRISDASDSQVFDTSDSVFTIWKSDWKVQNIRTTKELSSVHFYNKDIGWLTGSSGQIFKTTDGGDSWEFKDSTIGETLRSIYFTDQNNGCVAGDRGTLLRTTDGGETWEPPASGKPTSKLYAVTFSNSDNGWVVGRKGAIHKTTNSGIDWQQIPTTITQSLYSVFFHNNTNGWATADDGFIFKTTDAGQTWEEILVDKNGQDLYSIHFYNENTGWVVGAKQTIFKTIDKGVTWTRQTADDVEANLNSIFCVRPNIAVAVGSNSTILKTIDGGETWIKELDLHSTANLNSVYMMNARDGWAVGYAGTVFNYKGSFLETKIESIDSKSPSTFQLKQNFPNPFNPETTINFDLAETSSVTIKIFEITGRELKTLADGENRRAGAHNVIWDGSDYSGKKVASGIYLCRLTSSKFSSTIKMTVLK